MKSIHFEEDGLQLPREVQLQRIQRVIRQELTPLQRQTLQQYYFQCLTLTQIAARRGVHKSTVLRTLRRAEDKLRRYIKY